MDAFRDGLTLYLNRGGDWGDFTLFGLDRDADGALRLASLPSLVGPPPAHLATLTEPSGPAGLIITPAGDLFFTDPDAHQVHWIDGCADRARPMPCLGGEGDGPTRFREPRGLLYHPGRRALLVADSGNSRVQLFDLASRQFLGYWTAGNTMQEPVALAGDDGAVFVADAGARRVLKLDALGQEEIDFWEEMEAGIPNGEPFRPVALAVVPGNRPTLIVLDEAGRRFFICTLDGTVRARFPTTPATSPLGLAVDGHSIYLGDNTTRRVLRFRLSGEFVGEAAGYDGPVAALAIGQHGDLLVHTGAGPAPLSLAVAGAVSRIGALRGGPFRNDSYRPEQRHRLRAIIDALPVGTSLGLHVFRRPAAPDAPDAPPMAIGTDDPFADDRWHEVAIGANATETLFAGAPEDEVWVGLEMRSEGNHTPTLRQIQLDFDHATPIEHLPAIYRESDAGREFLNRFLALFESAFDDADRQIDDLPRLCDPAATPEPFLPWLGGWLAEGVHGDWAPARRRDAIASAFDRSGWRGTAAGLRQALREEAGVEAVIEEPIVQASWWSLPADDDPDAPGVEQSILGFSTALVAAEPQGAVLGSTATLDASHLIAQEDYGAPLFAELAHRIAIRLYRGATYSEQAVASVEEIVAREKPAHVAHEICVVEPRMRIGFQTRIGIDSIVAAPPAPDILSVTGTAEGLRLGGEPAGRMGISGEIGQTTRLGG